jgi:phosphoglycerate dehydrogenase-like enzyme
VKIVFHGQNAATFRPGLEALLADAAEITVVADAVGSAADQAAYRSADVIVGIRAHTDLPRPDALRLFHAPAAGTDAIDRRALPAGVPLCNCFGHEQAIAEYVMAALLLRHVPLPAADAGLRQGSWRYWSGAPGGVRTELGGTTIGLMGYGHIGKAIAARAKAFGLRVTVANRSLVPLSDRVDESYTLDDISAFMGSADAIVVSLPHLPATTGIVGAAALAAMRSDAVIINVGRGPVIDEQALFDALSSRAIGGGIIDTWYTYPSAETPNPQPSRLPFNTLDNVLMTPHMSGWTQGTIKRRQQTIADNINRLARGDALVNLVE